MARPKPISTARRLRRDMTEAEQRLWGVLRQRPLGAKFRRQHPIGPYVADFACPAARLVIELDGGQHADPAVMRRDARRTAEIEARGWRVLRFWNLSVFEAPDQVGDAILDAVRSGRGRKRHAGFEAR